MDVLTLTGIAIILLSIILQMFISKNNNWGKGKKFGLGIGLFLLLSTLYISFTIVYGYVPHMPINGIALLFILAWAVMISAIAGFLQVVTAVVVWLYQRRTKEQ